MITSRDKNLPSLFEKFNESLLSDNQKQEIYQFLQTDQLHEDENASKYITSSFVSLGFLTRLFNQLDSIDDKKTPEEFTKDFLTYYDENQFQEFVYIKTYKLVNTLLNDDGTLNQKTLEIFADITKQKPQEVLDKYYGPKDNCLYSSRVKSVADLITAACVTGVSVIYTNALRAAKSSDASPELKMLAKTSSVFTRIDEKGDLMDEKFVSFKTIADDLTFNKLNAYTNPEIALSSFLIYVDDYARYLNATIPTPPTNDEDFDKEFALIENPKKSYIHLDNAVRHLAAFSSNSKMYIEGVRKKNQALILNAKAVDDAKTEISNRLMGVEEAIDKEINTINQQLEEMDGKKPSTKFSLWFTNETPKPATSKLKLKQKLDELHYEKSTIRIIAADLLDKPYAQKAIIQTFATQIEILLTLDKKSGNKINQSDINTINNDYSQLRVLALTNQKEFAKVCVALQDNLMKHFSLMLSDNNEIFQALSALCRNVHRDVLNDPAKITKCINQFNIDIKNLFVENEIIPQPFFNHQFSPASPNQGGTVHHSMRLRG